MKLKKLLAIATVPLVLAGCNMFESSAPKAMSPESSGTCSGNMYLQKYGCNIDRVQAAAQNGEPDAQYALGYMYYYGIGTARDPQTARLWIQRAADKGQPLAKQALNMMSAGGSPMSGSVDSNDQSSRSGSGGGSNDGPSLHQNKEDVNQLNSATPTKPMSSELPAYGKSQKAQTSTTDTSATSTPPDTSDSSSAPASVTDSESSQATPMKMSPRTASEKALMKVASTDYSLQLIAGYDLDAIQRFVKHNKLEAKTYIYSANYDNGKWYMLIYGKYPNAKKALSASKALPESVQHSRPWVKSYAMVQKEIQAGKVIS